MDQSATFAQDILALFKDILDHPQAPATWDDPSKLARWQQLFHHAPELARVNAPELVTLLISALAASTRSIYQPASYILRHITVERHPFNVFGTDSERLAGHEAWRRWWQQAKFNFAPRPLRLEHSTLIVDEIPGRIVGNDDEPPGRIVHLDRHDQALWEISSLKMPYDAVRLADGSYLVNIIRARAVWKVARDGTIVWQRGVGGYPCSLQLLPDHHILVAGWDDDVPGFVRELDADGDEVWKLENLCWPWKAQRLENGNTLIADAGTNRIYEVNVHGEEVWAVNQLGPAEPKLFDALGPVYCQRLMDGNTLVSIRGLSKIVELDMNGHVVWEVSNDSVSNQYSAVRLWNGHTLIADAGHFRVIELSIDKQIVWEKTGFGYPAKAYRY